ncbi:MAG TPA: extracellular solute-binding protein [Devosia sp.]|jgi:multiple sugar transport system substrate-binding protein|uniref:ABC transporter substrate-binding protein n=1 Tax=Devosia sp. TaxID=1871048 RepID=UPI002DDD13AD|nr:extracellular solute-binding protein [Devosia sp.]HEV2517120.1 extracellular solute-binding protein [Devosia sp.]
MITRRRTVLKGALALLGATALAPVARAQSDGVRAIFWGGQARAERTFAVFDLFQNKLGTAPVVGEFMGFTDYWPKVATQTAGGNAPDLIQMDYRYIVEYAQRGALTPLDDYLGGALDLADFDADQIEAGKVDGKFYGVSMGAGGFCLQVNASAFERAGLPVPGPTTTYAELLGMAGDFNAANAGMRMLQDGSGNEPALENWLRQRGKALYTAEGELAFGTEDAAEWFTLWADLRGKQACVTAEEQAISTGTIDTSMLVTGRAASGFTGVNELIAYQALVKDTLAVTNMPLAMAGGKGGQYRKPTMMWTLAQTSKLKDEAVELINFFVRDLEAASLLGLERGIPASAASREHIAGSVTDLERQTLDFFANLGDLLGPIPPSPPSAAGEISQSLLGTLSQEVAFGAKSPEDAAAQLVNGAQDILARAG